MLQLDAMTLRGVGSYIRGSRLEVRPLTILSGVNGSGKSTWFKALNLLKRSTEKEMLPFAFDADDSNAFNVEFMNYSLNCSSDLADIAGGDEEDRFGPPACVGMEFSATKDMQLDESDSLGREPRNPEERFLLEGACPKGTKLHIRIAHPTSNVDSHILTETPGMYHHFELGIGGTVLTFQRVHNPRGGNDRPEDYTLYRSSPRFAGNDESKLRDLVAKRIQQLLRLFFQGYFHISAVRSLSGDTSLCGALGDLASPPPEDSYEVRNVQGDGQRALHVFVWNSRGKARQKFVDDDGRLGLEKEVADGLNQLLQVDMTGEDPFGDEGDLGRFTNCYLGGPQVPKQFSSGFHQLFPIIVQLGVMHPGELLTIENPEVHLHPDLQLEVSNYLLKQSRRGRRIMLETHSDLIIRRVVRAILEEEEGMSQQHVSLNFSAPKQEAHVMGSFLRPFGIDNAGRIEWPEGFMDASINESQRLMEVMYGRRQRAEGEA